MQSTNLLITVQTLPAGCKQTEVGVIPDDWIVDTLGSLCEVVAGRDLVKGDFSPIADHRHRYPIYSNALTSRGLYGYSRSFQFEPEAITVTARGDIGHAEYRDVPFCAIGRLLVLSPKRRCDLRFLKEYINNSVNFALESTGVPQLTAPQLSKYTVAVPPTLAEQQAIAEALGDVDALIGALDRLIAKKRAIKQGAMQELLTGRRRLPGFDGVWEMRRLGELGATYGGLTGKTKSDFGNGSARYIPFLNIITNVVIDPYDLELVCVAPSERQNQAQVGDLFFNGSSETPEEVGMCSVLLDDLGSVYLNSFCFGFRLEDHVEAHGLYLAYFFRSGEGRALLYSLAQGATRYNLSKTNFLRLEIPFPAFQEQTAIAAILSDMDAEIAALERRRDKTKLLKQGMMQELLTGRIRLL